MGAVNQETMKQYFSLLQEVLVEYNLTDKQSQIYNVHESGLGTFDHRFIDGNDYDYL